MSNLAYKEKARFEIHNGQIVNMSPSAVVNHNRVIVNITRIFSTYLKGRFCTVFSDGVDVHLTEKDTFIPDVMIVCNKDIIKNDGIYGAPDLVVEVLSPGSAKNDRGYKKDLYEKSGVKEYWLVGIETRSIEVYLLKDGKYILDNVYSIFPDYELKKLTAEEKAAIAYEFTPSLFPEMTIVIEDVFEGMF
ncbi:MAG: Uma2 family endonuclease [Sporomusaceae bacterium]|nr:Uma2 family endonuclease [Sporomusaceae bacterium]